MHWREGQEENWKEEAACFADCEAGEQNGGTTIDTVSEGVPGIAIKDESKIGIETE